MTHYDCAVGWSGVYGMTSGREKAVCRKWISEALVTKRIPIPRNGILGRPMGTGRWSKRWAMQLPSSILLPLLTLSHFVPFGPTPDMADKGAQNGSISSLQTVLRNIWRAHRIPGIASGLDLPLVGSSHRGTGEGVSICQHRVHDIAYSALFLLFPARRIL